LSYSVASRTRELGIRRALGAPTAAVLQLVLAQALSLVVAGVVIGLARALALTRVLKTLLYDVASNDPATFAVVPLLLIGVALLASYLPGRRAARVDPGEALRAE